MSTEEQELDYLESTAGQGFENVDPTDLERPYLKLLQDISPECKKSRDEYVEGAEAGMFYLTASKALLGSKIELIILDYEKVWNEWKPGREGFVASHKPDSIEIDKEDYSEWRNPKTGNIIEETTNFFVLVRGHEEEGPALFSLKKTGLKYAKKMILQLLNQKTPKGSELAMYCGSWALESILNKKGQNDWYNIGEDKKAAFQFLEYVPKEIFTEHVIPSLQLVKSMKGASKMLENKPKAQIEASASIQDGEVMY